MYYILLPQNFWRYVKPQKVQITLWCLHFNTVPKVEIQCPPPHLQLAQNAPEGLIETLYLKFSPSGKALWRPSHTLLAIMSHDISTPENQDTPLVWSNTHDLAKWHHRPREKEKAGSKVRLYYKCRPMAWAQRNHRLFIIYNKTCDKIGLPLICHWLESLVSWIIIHQSHPK